jgi:PTH1 family peptidyl-tRNA hydrolase
MKMNEYILIGLGNIGDEYNGTRHNIGKDIIQYMTDADIIEDNISIPSIHSYMNNYGVHIYKFLRETSPKEICGKNDLIKYINELAPRIIIVHDDLDIPFSEIKICISKGGAGHNGVEGIITALKTNGFIRVRVGILSKYLESNRPHGAGKERFVLKRFSSQERYELDEIHNRVARVINTIGRYGVERAMNDFNHPINNLSCDECN